jgi:hypothetical protein
MEKKNIRIGELAAIVILALLCGTAIQAKGADLSAGKAASVRQLLDGIAGGRPGESGGTGTSVVSESDLNAYIADRLVHHKIAAVKKLTVRLLDVDHLSGSVDFDARQLQLDPLLGEHLTFDFKGIVQNRERAVRLHLIALTLNGYPVKPQVLEFVLGRLGAADGSESNRVGGWHSLPSGIEAVRVSKGSLVVWY